jgi:hypothetical protein
MTATAGEADVELLLCGAWSIEVAEIDESYPIS